MSLGTPPRAILGLVLRPAGTLIAAGIMLGIGGASLLARFLEDMLFQVKTSDWRAYAGATVVLVLVAIAASLIPARRGAKLDPIAALSQE